MELKNIVVKRIVSGELPVSLIFRLNYLSHTKLNDFVVIYDANKQVLYVNERVPEADISRLVEYASFTGPYINMDETENGLGCLGDYIYNKYGECAWKCLLDAYNSRQKAMKMFRAEKQAEEIIPLIKAVDVSDEADVFDEYLTCSISQAGMKTGARTACNLIGYDTKYVFWLGYLIGSGKVKVDEVG